MALKLSIFTTTTYPVERGDLWDEPMLSYSHLADEVVVVDGDPKEKPSGITTNDDKHFYLKHPWPKEFSWGLIGEQFQRAYEACTGDVVIHADLDFIFHEQDYEAIRQACEDNNDQPAFSMLKRQFILPDRFNLKSRLVVAVNKGKFGDRIRFDSGGDGCQPSLDGRYIEPGTVPDVKIPIWNYEKLLKTEAQIKDDVGRMARAWHSNFGEYKLGGPDDESAYREWLKMTVGRFNKPQEHIGLEKHPKVMQDTIANLKPSNWGYNGLNNLERNDYV